MPQQLGPVSFSLGVIAGCRSVDWLCSCLLPHPNDGRVSVERTRVAGMAEHVVLPVSHAFIMQSKAAIELTRRFLETGSFQ
jgi:hypothetical protein